MLEIKSKKLNYGINFPTELSEITVDALTELTKDIKLPNHYCIVALCCRTKLFSFAASMKNGKDSNVQVTPLLAKISEENAKEVNVSVGDKVIVDRSSLERGVHLTIPTLIATNNAYAYLDKDPDLSKAIITGNGSEVLIDPNINKSLAAGNSPYIYIINFKILPVNDLYGSVPVDSKVIDPFKSTKAN